MPTVSRGRDPRSVPSIEDLGIEVAEECGVQPAYHFGNVRFFDNEGQIYFRSSLRNHADVDIRQHAENSRSDATRLTQVLSYQAHNGLRAVVFHVRKLGQVRGECGNGLIRIHGERDTNL